MIKAVKLFFLFLVFAVNLIYSQNATISITKLSVSSVDFAAFAFESNLTNQPRILQIAIYPPGLTVSVEGVISWKKNSNSGFQKIASFRSQPFSSRTFYNDEIGTSSLPIASTDYNSDLLTENIKIGKPSGVYNVEFILFDANGNELNRDNTDFIFLNPTPPIIELPIEGSSYDIGSIPVQWTESQGAERYRIKANYIEEGQSPEEALNGADPLVNDKEVMGTAVNFRDLLSRELLAGKDIVLVVKAVVEGTGGSIELASPLVTFKTNSTIASSSSGGNIDPNILELANLLQGKVSQVFINQLRDGEIPIDEIQITDENNETVTFNSLLDLLTYLDSNSQSLISITYTAQ